jgi:Na+-translocating ferredoxin:NAD+ oxidoreductase subunit G
MKAAFKLAMILFIVCGLAAGALGFVNAATKERIAEYARIAKLEALKKVLPEAEEFAETEPGKTWEARAGGAAIGTVHLVTTQGYSGPIEAVFGMRPDGTLTGVRVLLQTETAGLGAKIATEAFLGQYKGLPRQAVALKKDDAAGGKVDAIAAATISSRALTKAVRAAADAADGKAPAAPGGGK